MILKTQGLSKSYGKIRALDGLNLEIREGEIIGILGPNGSGKTTTLALVLGVIFPTEGTFEWFGGNEENFNKRLGTILETPNFYEYMSGMDNLKVVQQIKDKPGQDLEELAKMVGLSDRIHTKVKTYSLGMKQRLAIAGAMVGDPDVLIFDEPTNGLDPQGIADVRNLIIDISKTGKTIIMASHILAEVEKICTHTVILQKGQLLTSGPVNTILRETNAYLLEAEDTEALKNCLKSMEGYVDSHEEEGGLLVNFDENINASHINTHCNKKGIVLSKLFKKESSLEDAFIEMVNNHKRDGQNQ